MVEEEKIEVVTDMKEILVNINMVKMDKEIKFNKIYQFGQKLGVGWMSEVRKC